MRPVKQKRACLVAALVLIVAGVLVWQFSRGAREPTYQGRRVSSWFQQYYRSEPFAPWWVQTGEGAARERALLGDQAAKALDALGTNALPYLLGVCFSTHQDTWFQTDLHAVLGKLPKPFRGRPFVPVSVVRATGEQRVMALKLAPAELLPSITNYLAGTNLSQRLTALRLLLGHDEVFVTQFFFPGPAFGIGPTQDLDGVEARAVEGATPWLARSLRSTNLGEQELALVSITRFGPALRGLLPDLMWLQAKSFQAESFAPTPWGQSLLWLCGQVLGAMRTNAAPALPLLKEQLAQLVRRAEQAGGTPSVRGQPAGLAGWQRLLLAEVICRIDAQELPATLALGEELRKGGRPCDLGQFADSLRRIGPNAKPAMPILLDMLDRKDLGESDFLSITGALQSLGVEKQALDRALLKVLQGQDPPCRIIAARALLQDDPGNGAAIDALIEIIRTGRPEDIGHAIPLLRDAGQAAKAAIPVLRQFRNRQEKGTLADLLRIQADVALARIEGRQVPKPRRVEDSW